MAHATLPLSLSPAKCLAGNSNGTSQINGDETPKKNYLERSVSLIDPKTASNHDLKKTLWTIASKATLVAFAVLAVAAFVAVGLFAPIYLPVVAITAFCLLSPAFQLHLRLKNIAEEEGLLAKQTRAFAAENDSLTTPGCDLAAKLSTMGIDKNKIKGISGTDDLKQLTPLIAQYEYWRKEIDTQKDLAERMSQNAQKILLDEPDNIEQINEYRLGSIECQEKALKAKIQAAFLHAVICNPQFTGEQSELYSTKQISFEERALGAQFKDPRADEFLVFKKSGVAPVTMSQMQNDKTMPISTLADRMLQAM